MLNIITFTAVSKVGLVVRVSDHGSEGCEFESRLHQDWTPCLSKTTQWARVLVHPGSVHGELESNKPYKLTNSTSATEIG